MIKSLRIRNFATIEDIELPISIVDLGLVRDVHVRNNTAHITIIFTSLFCPYSHILIAIINRKISQIPGINAVHVTVDRDTVWTPDMVSEKGNTILKKAGFF